MALRNRACIVIFLALIALASGGPRVMAAAQAAALKIVVLEGEGAVNIIQQKTAVAPVVEVRDRNNQPVSGVFVIFKSRRAVPRSRARDQRWC